MKYVNFYFLFSNLKNRHKITIYFLYGNAINEIFPHFKIFNTSVIPMEKTD